MRIEIRNDNVLIEGYVNVTGRDSRILPSPKGQFKEQIMPKTFEKALMKGNNVDLLFNHNRDKKLGSTFEKNLELREDSIGLRASALISDELVMQKARNGELRGWSFGFVANRDTWLDGEDGIQRRMVADLDLLEVSILDKQPAYIAQSIEARGEEALFCEQRMEEPTTVYTDNREVTENPKDGEEKRDQDSFDYNIFEQELTILQLRGS